MRLSYFVKNKILLKLAVGNLGLDIICTQVFDRHNQIGTQHADVELMTAIPKTFE
jgi:hypothetical protein